MRPLWYLAKAAVVHDLGKTSGVDYEDANGHRVAASDPVLDPMEREKYVKQLKTRIQQWKEIAGSGFAPEVRSGT